MIMSNSLAIMRPELVREWSDKNLPLTPDKITYGSNKIVWWKAACGHEWQTSVKARSKGENCPVCSGARVIEGINDLAGKSGKHVMCEKPMAASYKEAQDMLAAAKESAPVPAAQSSTRLFGGTHRAVSRSILRFARRFRSSERSYSPDTRSQKPLTVLSGSPAPLFCRPSLSGPLSPRSAPRRR